MDRREFLKQVAAWSAGLAAAPPLFRIDPLALAEEAAAPVVAVARGKDYEALVATVLKPLGGIGAFVKKGQKVVVKPNIGWDRKPEQAANTHPLVVKALVKQCLDAGAARVSVFDRTCNDERRTYASSGIQDALKGLSDERVSCSFLDGRRFVKVAIAKGKELKEWEFYKDALEADVYLNVPIAKHHGLAKLTLGLKNVMGVIGGNRGQIHSSIAQKLAELNTVIRPKLTLIDGTRILLRHGPQGGSLDDVKVCDMLLASADPVALDAYATTELFGMKPEEIEVTVAAGKLGLGQIDLTKVKILKG